MVVLLLIQMNDSFEYFIKRIFGSDIVMIHTERCFQVANIVSEKEPRSEYDEHIGLLEEFESNQKSPPVHLNWPETPSITLKGLTMRYRP